MSDAMSFGLCGQKKVDGWRTEIGGCVRDLTCLGDLKKSPSSSEPGLSPSLDPGPAWCTATRARIDAKNKKPMARFVYLLVLEGLNIT